MIKWAGWLTTLCGVVHTLGSLVETAPRYAEGWLSWELLEECATSGGHSERC